MKALLDLLYVPTAWFFALPPTAALTALGLMIAYAIAIAGFALARMGIKPLWVLLLLIPWVNVLAIWMLAYKKWPAEKFRSN